MMKWWKGLPFRRWSEDWHVLLNAACRAIIPCRCRDGCVKVPDYLFGGVWQIVAKTCHDGKSGSPWSLVCLLLLRLLLLLLLLCSIITITIVLLSLLLLLVLLVLLSLLSSLPPPGQPCRRLLRRERRLGKLRMRSRKRTVARTHYIASWQLVGWSNDKFNKLHFRLSLETNMLKW